VTKKLYYQDAFQQSFEAKVLRIENNYIVLDQTCFYPQGGGQVGDRGELNGIPVTNTVVKEGAIFHELEVVPTFRIGDIVEGKIDWPRRYRTMCLHSASHIMEYYLFKICGKAERLGSNVDDRRDSSTYVYEKIDPLQIREVEKLCNDFILKNNEIAVGFVGGDPECRYWKCGEIEELCGGTHPKNTSEIGRISLKRERKGARKELIITTIEKR